jgi:predicted unusual protein kinase regulating ubiquinone biosynthesis (AarF/ABC1/UbiB family)
MPTNDKPVATGRVQRAMPLAGFSTRAAAGRFVAGLRERAGDGEAVRRFHERTAERYVELLGHSKGAMMKIGQLGSLIDTGELGTGGFAPYQKALTRLQADAPPMAPALVRDVVNAELPSGIDTFADFEDEPIAAASIGQVHRAELPDGRQVAVKVQYLGVAQAIREDLANTELVATLLRFITSASGFVFDPRDLAREYTVKIGEEVDYRREAANIAAFAELFRDHPFIRVPDLIPQASSAHVLTMSYLSGMDWAAARSATVDQQLRNTWAEVITRFSYSNIRHANLLHADPHPGNYRFGLDGSVGFVDFGCVTVLPETRRRSWVTLMRAVLERRAADVRAETIVAGFIADDSALTAQELQHFWEQVFHEVAVAPQPVTYTRASSSRTARLLFGIDSSNPMSRFTVPEAYVFAPRVQQALTNVCGALNATLPARAIADDMDGIAEPATDLGRLHHDWVRERGLPGALDDHTAARSQAR